MTENSDIFSFSVFNSGYLRPMKKQRQYEITQIKYFFRSCMKAQLPKFNTKIIRKFGWKLLPQDADPLLLPIKNI